MRGRERKRLNRPCASKESRKEHGARFSSVEVVERDDFIGPAFSGPANSGPANDGF